MRHSQKFSATPLACWIIIDKTGEICCGHCINCMAGLGEVCTHVAAVLFYLEALFRIQGKETCTQQSCKWILPSFSANVEYLPIADIDFTSAASKKLKLDDMINSVGETSSTLEIVEVKRKKIPSCEEMDCFYEHLSRVKASPLFCL